MLKRADPHTVLFASFLVVLCPAASPTMAAHLHSNVLHGRLQLRSSSRALVGNNSSKKTLQPPHSRRSLAARAQEDPGVAWAFHTKAVCLPLLLAPRAPAPVIAADQDAPAHSN